MSLMLFGLLCLCFVSFGGTEKLRGGRTATRKLSEGNEAIHVLFSMIDGQILLDNTITASELKKAWLKHDSDGNEVLSEDELRVALENLKLGYSKEAKFFFGYIGLIDEEIEYWLQYNDNDHDGTVTESDLVNEYNHYLEMLTKAESMRLDIIPWDEFLSEDESRVALEETNLDKYSNEADFFLHGGVSPMER